MHPPLQPIVLTQTHWLTLFIYLPTPIYPPIYLFISTLLFPPIHSFTHPLLKLPRAIYPFHFL